MMSDDAVAADHPGAVVSAECRTVAEAARTAMSWSEAAVEMLHEEAPALRRELRRDALRAERLAAAAQRRMAVAVFGPSQNGKSYLVGALASHGERPAAIRFGPRTFDFTRDINPEGGKESTGLVTRFTLDSTDAPATHPVSARCLSETDILSILANAFFEDFDRDTVEPPSVEAITTHLAGLRSRGGPTQPLAPTEDQIFQMSEYFERSFSKHPIQAVLRTAFWPEAEKLAPRLSLNDRIDLFSVLWNRVTAFTEAAQTILQPLEQLGFPDKIFLAMLAVEPKATSVIDVNVMRMLGRDEHDRVPVLTASGRTLALPRSILTAVIAELILQLGDAPFPFFMETDLLDFPGARSRDRYNGARAEQQARENLVMLIIRGKVAYLYERYLADQEISSMLLCLKHSTQEVKTLPEMINNWVQATQGHTPQHRQNLRTALFLVLTFFDAEFEEKKGAEDTVERWSTRIETTISQYLALAHTWPLEWSPGQPFRNLFWLRNPNVKNLGLLDYDERDREIWFRNPDRMLRLRANFLANKDVRRHFSDPDIAWDAAVSLNDGGVTYLVNSLVPTCNPRLKVTQIQAQISEIAGRLKGRLRPYYVTDDLDVELAKQIGKAERVAVQIGRAWQRFGSLIAAMQIGRDELLDTLRATALQDAALSGSGGGVEDDILSFIRGKASLSGGHSVPTPKTDDFADRLADSALAAWNRRLHGLSTNPSALGGFQLEADDLDFLMGQLAAAARRLAIRRRIADAIRRRGIAPEKLTASQLVPARIAANEINEFIYRLDFGRLPEEDRYVRLGEQKRPAFRRPAAIQDLPALSEQPSEYSRTFAADWALAFVALAAENVRRGDMGVDPELNRKLGECLSRLATVG